MSIRFLTDQNRNDIYFQILIFCSMYSMYVIFQIHLPNTLTGGV